MERSINPENLDLDHTLLLDVRRDTDYAASNESIPGAFWKNPERIDEWVTALPKTRDVVIYCVRGGSVSSSVVERLRAEGIKARFVEGGIEGFKASGGKVVAK